MGIVRPFEFEVSGILPILAVLNLSTFLVLLFMLRKMRISQTSGYILMSTYFGLVLSILLVNVL